MSKPSQLSALSPIRPGAGAPGRCHVFGEPPAGDAPPAGGTGSGTAVVDPPSDTATMLRTLGEDVARIRVGVDAQGPRLAALEEEAKQRKAEFESFARSVRKGAGLPGYDPNASDDPAKRFSMRRAILGKQAKWGVSDITGEDTSKFIERELIHEYTAHVKSQTGTVASEGGFLVGVTMMPDLIPFLRPQSVIDRAGVPFITGAAGNDIVWPKELSAIPVTRDGEVATISPSQVAFGDVTLRRKRMTALTYISISLLRQTAGQIQTIVERSMAKSLALKIDLDFFTGQGNALPIGVKNTNGIGTVSFSAIDYAGADQTTTDLLDSLIYKLKIANAYENPVFAMHPQAVQKLRTLKDAQGLPILFLATDQNGREAAMGGNGGLTSRLWGHRLFETTQLSGSGTDTDCIFFEPSQGVSVLWDTIEIAGSEHFSFDTGRVAIRAMAFQDSALLQGGAAAIATSWST